MLRIVMDSNVVISSLFWDGNERSVLKCCIEGSFQNIISSFIVDEVHDVLSRKFMVSKEKTKLYIQQLLRISEFVFPLGSIDVITTDPSDNFVLETAVLGKAAAIITGDRHLLDVSTYQGIQILNARGVFEQMID